MYWTPSPCSSVPEQFLEIEYYAGDGGEGPLEEPKQGLPTHTHIKLSIFNKKYRALNRTFFIQSEVSNLKRLKNSLNLRLSFVAQDVFKHLKGIERNIFFWQRLET